MADRARNQRGSGKAVTFNVLTPMTRWGSLVVGVILWILDRFKRTQKTAKQLAFLPFVHWVIVRRNRFPRLDDHQPAEKLHYDYLFFLSTFNGRGALTSRPSPTCSICRSTRSGSGASAFPSPGPQDR